MVYISFFIFATYTVISVTALGAPRNFKNENKSQTSLTFSWQLPSNAGININKYYIECSRRNDNEIICAEFSGNLRRGTVHGLAVYSSYSCKIQATSTGTWSASVIQKTLKGAPCLQPLGMENNVIPDDRLTSSAAASSDMQISSVMLNSPSKWCSINAYIQIDLGRIMTITGLAIQGDTAGVSNVNIKYGIKSPSDLVELWEESGGRVIRNFAYPASKYTKRHWFEQDAFTVRHIRISPVVTDPNKVVCLKIELYGCAEIKIG
ncbi:lactadherin-like [Hydractinia symbiolongicarpus]|uniref:lactadherin-like n=1 Tax=Hydractinia symbiolongicarpus TaxID=13093 RepID=UPI00254A01F8|nr:lactadherin-like [Hydractinia symbiolongicarpus]